MKVWMNRLDEPYSGGIILVAANSAEEAHEAFHADPDLYWMWDNITWENPPYVEDNYYHPQNWHELPMLTANVDKPQVLAEGSHRE